MIESFRLWSIQYSACEQNVGAGINALISISDGIGPSIFCRKMETARPLRKEMDGKGVFLATVGIFTLTFINASTFFICTLTCHVINYVSRQGKVEIGEMKA